MSIVPGKILAGKYRVERILGKGGMGVVVAATHLALEQRVALKFMLPEAAANGALASRFIREARAAVRLRSENVARILDVGTLENGAPYIAMEFLDGEDLSGLLQRRGPIPVPEVSTYVLQACIALAEAHGLGIVHRDLKPANLFLTSGPDGVPLVKVIDFGISKMGSSESGSFMVTRTGVVMGSPSYMSPEQLRSAKDADARSDIWAVGVILYQLVSGILPFHADSLSGLSIQVANDPTPRLPVNLGPHAAIESVIRRCLEKTPTARYQTVAALAAALVPFAPAAARPIAERVAQILRAAPRGGSMLGPGGPPSAPEVPTRRAPGTVTGSPAEVAGGSPARSRSRARFIAGAIVVAAAATVVALTSNDPSPPTAPTPSHAPAPPTATAEPTTAVDAAIGAIGAVATPVTASPPPPEAPPLQAGAPDAPPTPAQPITGAPPPPGESWTARITSVPDSALVYSGGRPLGHTPFSTRVDRATARRFILRCQGYADVSVELSSSAPTAARRLPRISGTPLGVECE